MRVLVIGMNGFGLMPTVPQKARKLIRSGKAVVVRKKPFTIRLLYKTGSTTQQCYVGIDTGSQHIGTALVSNNTVLDKSEWILRSTMEKRSLMETRREYRRGRRFRKTRYRHPKFKPHTKRFYSDGKWRKQKAVFTTNRPVGWLPPSVQSKVDHHIRIIQKHMDALPLNTQLSIELARFDMHKIQNPDISGVEYQYGPMYDYDNVKAFVMARDGYKCKRCGAKIGSARKDGTVVKGYVHHIDFRINGATDNPQAMVTLCDRHHRPEDHQPGGCLYDWMLKNKKFVRGLRDMTMENIVSDRLRSAFPEAFFTYGNFTKVNRTMMGLTKSHANDAVAVSQCKYIMSTGDITIHDDGSETHYKQVRRKKRSLHEANPRKGRKVPNREARRNCKNVKCVDGFDLYSKVRYAGQIGYITGFTGHGAYVQTFDGKYILPSGKSYKQIKLSELKKIDSGRGWITQFIPALTLCKRTGTSCEIC